MRYTSHRDIIDAWPSLPDFALDHGVQCNTAKQWRTRNSIPPERWLETVQIAEGRGIPDVTHKVLHDLWWLELGKRAAAKVAPAEPHDFAAEVRRKGGRGRVHRNSLQPTG
jgi:hypothetical protein